MNRTVPWLLLGVCLAACEWREDIAKDSDGIDAQAESEVREACERVCGLEDECGPGVPDVAFSTCSCSGEDCDCGPLEECVAGCVRDTADYRSQGEACASDWSLVLNCLGAAPCDVLLGMESPTELEDIPECEGAASVDLSSCESLAPEIGCGGDSIGASSSAGVGGDCQLEYAGCEEGDLRLSCRAASTPGDGYFCECLMNGQVETTEFPDPIGCGFDESDPQATIRLANLRCGWSIPDGTPRSADSPVSCIAGSEGGSAGGAAVLSCNLGRQTCSDGADYEVACTDSGDGYTCECSRDGSVREVSLPTSACPLQADPAGFTHAANAVCGWQLDEL